MYALIHSNEFKIKEDFQVSYIGCSRRLSLIRYRSKSFSVYKLKDDRLRKILERRELKLCLHDYTVGKMQRGGKRKSPASIKIADLVLVDHN